MRLILSLLFLGACLPDRSPPATPNQPPPTATSARSARLGCAADDAAEQACVAKGSGFQYGPVPDIPCSGIERPHEVRLIDPGRQLGPCACNDLSEIQKRRKDCQRLP